MHERAQPDAMVMIRDYGAWNGGTLLDNTVFERQGMMFKGGIPVTDQTIMERIGVRTRMAADPDERIGLIAVENLLETSDLDPANIKLVIGATNVGEDKWDPGPLVRHIHRPLQTHNPEEVIIREAKIG